MEFKIIKRATVLNIEGLYHEGKIYIPAEAMDSFIGLWKEQILFLDSPLAEKRICVTVLSPDSARGLPPALEEFLALCTAAGAHIIYHDGGKFPPADLILAVELNGSHASINYLGPAFRSKPLAKKIGEAVKSGLKLTYLPDPVKFKKPQYNLKMGLMTWFSTPAVAIQWPAKIDDLLPWLFRGLMDFFGRGANFGGQLFPLVAQKPVLETAAPLVRDFPLDTEAKQEEKDHQPPPKVAGVRPQMPRVKEEAAQRPAPQENTAFMSRAMYPDFFAKLEAGKSRIKKEPFT